jgi:cysteine synthase B
MDSTSGNNGIAYAMIGAAKGYRVRLVMPGNVSEERRQLVSAFGAEVEYSDPLEGSDGEIRLVRAMHQEKPHRNLMHDHYHHAAHWLRISVQPAEPWHGLEGLKHMETSIVPGIYDPSIADEDMGVETEPAYDLARELARTEGILAGHSSGAALFAVREIARGIGHGVIVTVLPDGGDRYLSTGLYRRSGT